MLATAIIVMPGHRRIVSINPNGLPTLVPASMGEIPGYSELPIRTSIPKLTHPNRIEPKSTPTQSDASENLSASLPYHMKRATVTSTP